MRTRLSFAFSTQTICSERAKAAKNTSSLRIRCSDCTGPSSSTSSSPTHTSRSSCECSSKLSSKLTSFRQGMQLLAFSGLDLAVPATTSCLQFIVTSRPLTSSNQSCGRSLETEPVTVESGSRWKDTLRGSAVVSPMPATLASSLEVTRKRGRTLCPSQAQNSGYSATVPARELMRNKESLWLVHAMFTHSVE